MVTSDLKLSLTFSRFPQTSWNLVSPHMYNIQTPDLPYGTNGFSCLINKSSQVVYIKSLHGLTPSTVLYITGV